MNAPSRLCNESRSVWSMLLADCVMNSGVSGECSNAISLSTNISRSTCTCWLYMTHLPADLNTLEILDPRLVELVDSFTFLKIKQYCEKIWEDNIVSLACVHLLYMYLSMFACMYIFDIRYVLTIRLFSHY